MAMNNQDNKRENLTTRDSLARYFAWTSTESGVAKLVKGLGILCLLLFIADFIVHRHAKVPGESWFGYHAIVGFVAFTLIVFGATQLRRLIKRDESYYGDQSVDSEEYPEGAGFKYGRGVDES